MWLLAGVRSEVYREGTALDKSLSAILPVASVWPFVRVNAVVSLKIGLSVEALDGQQGLSQQSSTVKPFQYHPAAEMQNEGHQLEMASKKPSRATASRNGRTNNQTREWTACAKMLQKGRLSN